MHGMSMNLTSFYQLTNKLAPKLHRFHFDSEPLMSTTKPEPDTLFISTEYHCFTVSIYTLSFTRVFFYFNFIIEISRKYLDQWHMTVSMINKIINIYIFLNLVQNTCGRNLSIQIGFQSIFLYYVLLINLEIVKYQLQLLLTLSLIKCSNYLTYWPSHTRVCRCPLFDAGENKWTDVIVLSPIFPGHTLLNK